MAAMFAVTLVNAQKISDKEVPAVVKSTLQKNYPDAREVKWEKEKGNYEAGFEHNHSEYSLLMDVSGKIIETEIEIKKEELPLKVKEYVAKNYAGSKIKEAAKITDAKGVVTYEAEVNGMDLIFDAQGNFIVANKD